MTRMKINHARNKNVPNKMKFVFENKGTKAREPNLEHSPEEKGGSLFVLIEFLFLNISVFICLFWHRMGKLMISSLDS